MSLFSLLGTHAVTNKGLYRRFIVTDTGHLDANAQLVEGFGLVHHLGIEAIHFDVPEGIDVNRVGQRTQVIFPLRPGNVVGHNGLLRLFEALNRLVKLGLGRQTSARVSSTAFQVKANNAFVFGGFL